MITTDMTTATNYFNDEPQHQPRAVTRPFRVDIGQFYVSNVCNLSCDGCISFNNLQFRGHYTWAASRERVEAWSRLLDIDYLCIIGGEPFANPELDTWVRELRRLWPQVNREFSIVTNGTYLDRWDRNQIMDWLEMEVTIEISCHDPRHWLPQVKTVEEILSQCTEPVILDIGYDDGILVHDYCLENGHRLITLQQHWLFGPNAVKRITDQGVMEFHDSNPRIAHQTCRCADCHYFVDGKMYKCPVTAAAEPLTQQMQMEPRAREILEKSRYCDPLRPGENLAAWFRDLMQPIAQCSLCPETWPPRQPIWPLSPKKPQVARVNLDSLTTEGVALSNPVDGA